MASIIYDSFLDDLAQGNVKSSDSFKAMLVTSAYSADKAAHTKRSSITNEASGTGYTAGGAAVTVTETKDTTNHRVDWTFAAVSWPNATVTARGVVVYKSRGGAATADELVCYVDLGSDISSTNGTFQASFSSPLRFQN